MTEKLQNGMTVQEANETIKDMVYIRDNEMEELLDFGKSPVAESDMKTCINEQIKDIKKNLEISL